MEIKINSIDSLRKEITIHVPAEKVEAKIKEQYKELQQNVDIRGFRKGHVPVSILEKRYGDDVLENVEKRFLAEGMEKTLEENNWDVMGEPIIRQEKRIDPKKDFTVSVVVDLHPTMELPDFATLEITKEKVEVTEEEIDAEVQEQRKRFGEWAVVEDENSVTQKGDRVIGNIVVLKDNEPFLDEENYEINLESDAFWIKDLYVSSKDFFGKKTGEEIVTEVTKIVDGEEDQPNFHITFKILDIKRPELPEMNQEFFDNLQVKDLEDLRKRIHDALLYSKNNYAEQAIEGEIWDAVLKNSSYEAPVSFIKDRVEEIKLDFCESKRREILAKAEKEGNLDNIDIDAEVEEAWKKEDVQAVVEEQIKNQLFLQKLSNELNVKISDREINDFLQKYAYFEQRPVAQIRKALEESGRLDHIIMQITKRKICQRIGKHVKLVEKEATTSKKEETASTEE
ncbi:MAG: trigger factor [Planctomycetes bacterium]|nr:trigger factor [Planctomycetota bacterium]